MIIQKVSSHGRLKRRPPSSLQIRFCGRVSGAIATSLVLQSLGKKEEALFVGQWAPTFLILGLYNKIVKVLGSDAHDRAYR